MYPSAVYGSSPATRSSYLTYIQHVLTPPCRPLNFPVLPRGSNEIAPPRGQRLLKTTVLPLRPGLELSSSSTAGLIHISSTSSLPCHTLLHQQVDKIFLSFLALPSPPGPPGLLSLSSFLCWRRHPHQRRNGDQRRQEAACRSQPSTRAVIIHRFLLLHIINRQAAKNTTVCRGNQHPLARRVHRERVRRQERGPSVTTRRYWVWVH